MHIRASETSLQASALVIVCVCVLLWAVPCLEDDRTGASGDVISSLYSTMTPSTQVTTIHKYCRSPFLSVPGVIPCSIRTLCTSGLHNAAAPILCIYSASCCNVCEQDSRRLSLSPYIEVLIKFQFPVSWNTLHCTSSSCFQFVRSSRTSFSSPLMKLPGCVCGVSLCLYSKAGVPCMVYKYSSIKNLAFLRVAVLCPLFIELLCLVEVCADAPARIQIHISMFASYSAVHFVKFYSYVIVFSYFSSILWFVQNTTFSIFFSYLCLHNLVHFIWNLLTSVLFSSCRPICSTCCRFSWLCSAPVAF